MKAHFCVAIDGPGGAGKGAAARAVAEHYGIHCVDTGAMFRALALALLEAGVDPADAAAVERQLPRIHLELRFREDGTQETCLEGVDVSGRIREERISRAASQISALPAVRTALLGPQRDLAERYSLVMDGRDIGTVVLPKAEVKIFLTADLEVRAKRRYEEEVLKKPGTTFEQVREQLRQRDADDAGRAVAPLRQAEDAIVVDNTRLNVAETAAEICRLIDERVPEA